MKTQGTSKKGIFSKLILALVFLVSTGASSQNLEKPQPGIRPGDIPPELAPPKLKPAPKKKTPEPDLEEQNEDDLWSGVEFGQKDFNFVLDLINSQYYNKNYDKRLSWKEAANYAMMFSVKNRVMELLPELYYQQRKKEIEAEKAKPDPLKEYEDQMDGETYKLRPEDKFLVRLVPTNDDQKKKRRRKLNDDELMKLTEREKERTTAKTKAWSETNFSQADFQRIQDYLKTFVGKMDFIRDSDGKMGKIKKAIFSEKMMWVYAASGYLVSLDPHSAIISRVAWEKSTKSVEDASFDGIGAMLVVQNEFTMIENPIEGQPAAKAGLRAGDLILEVNGKSTHRMMLTEVVRRIKGKRGTWVTLKIERQGTPKPFVVKVQRAFIELKNVSSKMLDKESKIGYIKLSGFIETSYDSIVEHFRKLEAQSGGFNSLKGLVLDLRGNSGGLLEQAVRIADTFIQKGRLVTVKYGTGREEAHQARLPNMTNIPVTVLVNAQSASASEILASAIQDHQRGLVIGERTFGKASVQQLIPNSSINHSYYTKITIARYYAPSGRTLQVIGVIPDVLTPPEADGKFPYRLREENYSGHLAELDKEYEPSNKKMAESLKPCTEKAGATDKIIKSNPNPQIKHDFQLLKAIDYMRCWINPELANSPTPGQKSL